MTDRVKVLYIAGAGRTGSTLVERLLGQIDGVFAGGELTFLWEYGLRGRCSCGCMVRECPVWRDVFASAYNGLDNVDVEAMIRLRRRFDSRYLPAMITAPIRRRLLSRLEDYPARVAALYGSIRDVTNSRVIVDSSKEPHYSYILRTQPGLDVRVLHLVRDARAVAYSWRRRREQAGIPGSMMEVRGPAVSAAYFTVSNIATELLWSRNPKRYTRVRYEDLLRDAHGFGDRLSELMDESLDLRGVLPDGRRAETASTHSVWGNPNRFEVGAVELREDNEWKRKMSSNARLASTVLNAPLLHRYGYPLRAPR